MMNTDDWTIGALLRCPPDYAHNVFYYVVIEVSRAEHAPKYYLAQVRTPSTLLPNLPFTAPWEGWVHSFINDVERIA